MLTTGFISITEKRSYHECICSSCGKSLGRIEIIYDDNETIEYNDIEGWEFCPFCGREL